MRRTTAAALAALSLTTLLGACSKSGQVEDKVGELFSKEFSIKDVKTTCPNGVKADKGEEFDCEVKGDFSSIAAGAGLPEGTTDAIIHVVFQKDNEFTITSISAKGSSSSSSSSDSTSS